MPMSPSRAFQQARDRGQKWLAIETERMSDRLEKFRVYHGYNKIQPTLFAKGLTTMLTVDDDRAHFKHNNFVSKSLSKRLNEDTSVRMSSLPKDSPDMEIAHQRFVNNSDSEEEFDDLYETKPEDGVRKDVFNNTIFQPELSSPTTKVTEGSRKTIIYDHINNNYSNKTSNSISKPPMISTTFECYNGNGLLNVKPYRSDMVATRF